MLLLITLLFGFLTNIPHDQVSADPFLTGSNILEITDYPYVKDEVSTGNCIQSAPYSVGGYRWVTEIYPRSSRSESSDYIGIFVRLMNTSGSVSALVTHRFQNWQTTTWSTDTPLDRSLVTFGANGVYGFRTFIKRSNLEASSYLKNDVLQIKTTIWVLNGKSSLSLPLPSITMKEDGSTTL